MEQYRIELKDGRWLTAGAQETCAIADVKLTGCVNPEEELMPGGVGSTMLEVTVLDPAGVLRIGAGDPLILYKEDPQPEQIGIFYAEKPERDGVGQYRITAYDRVSKLDKDLGQWLYDLSGWPYTLQTFARMVCEQCGVELENALWINSAYPVGAFSGSGITGRQLMRWICQLGGCFCRATPRGTLEFAWYSETQTCLRPTGTYFYYHNGLSDADYVTQPIEKVQLHLTNEDIGAVYPDEAGEKNTLRITGNYLLGGTGAAALEEAARQLYGHLKDIRYTPCTVKTTAKAHVQPGDVITVEDRGGVLRTVYVMSCVVSEGMLSISCTGSSRRDSTGAVNTARYQALTGKVLNLRADIEGLKIEHADGQKNLASLSLSLDGISTQVNQNKIDAQNLKTVCTTLQQTGEQIQLQVQTLSTQGTQKVKTSTGYTFDEDGLRISKQGQEMENLLDNTGMYVRRSGQTILQANNAGVEAADVVVRNYLVIGDHARFEDYTDGLDMKRTACFYLS